MVGVPLDPGQLSHRLVLESFAEVSDGQGGSLGSWTVLGAVWAHIEPMASPTFTDMAGGERAVVTHRIVMRFRQGKWRHMRIVEPIAPAELIPKIGEV